MKTAPHILHVITGIDRGGAENHLFDLVKHQRASGRNVGVAYLRGSGYWTQPLAEIGVPVHPLALRFYGDAMPLMRLRRLIRGGRFDLVHAHLPPAELYTRLALLGIGRRALPLLISKHNEARFCDAPGQRALGRWVAARAEHIVAISDAVKRYMAGAGLGVDAAKIETIRYGFDGVAAASSPRGGQAARTPPEQPAAGTPPLRIGFVGRLVLQKDLPTLFRGFAKFAATFPNAQLVIVGIGPLEAELRALADELRIADRVLWTGFREDIFEVMRSLDILALTSTYEGFGLVLLEAMAARLPIVATRISAIPEVVVDGETGLLVEPRTPASVASALQKLTDPDMRARLGAAGHARVRREFTLEKMCARTDALYARHLRNGEQPSTNHVRDLR